MKSKAIFLLVIFLLNTIIGFGCALGMEGAHQDENHSHEDKVTPIAGLYFSKEDICCKTLVYDLVSQSKLVPETGKEKVVFPVLWLPDYSLSIPLTEVELDQCVYVGHRERPPNGDIRIVIQSFQI